MLHLIAFIVIGLVVGGFLHWGTGIRARHPAIALVAGLVGALAGGYLLILIVGYVLGKFLSLLGAIVIAAVIVWLASRALGRA